MPALSLLSAFKRIVGGARTIEDEAPCLALSVIAQKLKNTRPCAVLELGSAFGSNIDFYSSFSGRICVEDLPSQMRELEAPGEATRRILDIESALNSQGSSQFDLIMCWDLLNYLEPSDLSALIAKLSKLSKPGTLLFCQVSIRKQQPASPSKQKIKSASKVLCQRQVGATIRSPRYHKGQLRNLLAPFKRQRSYLMANGYEEYIFEFPAESAIGTQTNSKKKANY